MAIPTEPTPTERRVLAFIWDDVEPGFGHAAFGAPEPDLTAEVVFGAYLRRYEAMQRGALRAFRPQPRAFRRDAEGALIVSCIGEKGRAYEAHLLLEPDGSVFVFFIARAFPEGVIGRTATQDEYDKVAALLRDAPVVAGERSISIWLKRLPEALAMQRKFCVAVAERQSDGALLAARITSVRDAVIEGEAVSVGQAYQAGVAPIARSQGLDSALIPYAWRTRAPRAYGLIDAGNVAIVQAMGGERVPKWSHSVRQVGLTAFREARAFGRPATPEDAPRLLHLMIAAHGRKEWRPPFDLAWVHARFTTIASYGFDAVRMTENAFVALWPAGDVVADVAPDRSFHARFAYMADYGFEGPSGLADFACLLEDARGRAFSANCTHVVGYTCDASPGRDVLAAGADFNDRMYLTLAPPEPVTLAETGIFVDPFFA